MKKVISFILSLYILIACLPINAEAANQYIIDNANILSNSEIKNLESQAKNISNLSNCKFYVLTTDDYYYSGDSFLSDNGLSAYDNMVVLIINLNEAPTVYYYIHTFGDANQKISDNEIEYLTTYKEVYDNLKANNIYDGASSFLAYAKQAYNDKLRPTPKAILNTVWISVAIGAATAIIVLSVVIFTYKRKLKSAKYPLDKYAKLNLISKEDIFLGSSVTKSRINDSSSSGSSGSSGHSSHGGGSGYRGGA